jgi:hypothetical protein
MSSEEGVAPSGDEFVGFYPGGSTGNEPKLEVSYCLDTETIGAETWFYRNVGNDKVAIVLFGGYPYLDSLYVNCIDDSWEWHPANVQFLDGLITNGFSILTPVQNPLGGNWSMYNMSYYDQNSTWVYDAVMWLMYNQSYKHILLFGFSGGGVVVSNEIQKDYATRFSAAVMTCAPVNWEGYGSMYHTALTAANTKAATCFPEPVDDSYYSYMSLYYNNTPSVYYNNGTLANKEWHDWTGGHSFFPFNDTASPYENATTVVVDWYNMVHPPNAPFTPTETGFTGLNCTYSSGTYVSNGDNVSYVFDWGDGTNTSTAQYPSGQNVSASHTWTAQGVYNVTVKAYDNATGLWSNPSPPLTVNMNPDLAVTGVLPLKTAVGQGYFMNVSVTAANLGDFNETFNITAYANNTAFQTQSLTLTAGDSANLTFTWNTTGWSMGNCSISAYAWPVLGETDTANNNFTGGTVLVTIPGDVNGDGYVGPESLNTLLASYGAPESGLPWNPNADIDNDGYIGPEDLNILLSHYGQHYP